MSKPSRLSSGGGLTHRIHSAVTTAFGEDSHLLPEIESACRQYETDLEHVSLGRHFDALLIAVVGAKGQGKTWVVRQFLKDPQVKAHLPSGDLQSDATLDLTWIGPKSPPQIDAKHERYVATRAEQMVDIGQPYTLLDTPGVTDGNREAAELAKSALALAPIKLLVIARDQVRAASNLGIARQIDGSVVIPVVTSVEPAEFPVEQSDAQSTTAHTFREDISALEQQLAIAAPSARFLPPVFVADFEITDDEAQSGANCRQEILDRLSELSLGEYEMQNVLQKQTQAAAARLRTRVAKTIAGEAPQLRHAVAKLNSETQRLPARVLDSLLGSENVLQAGVRMQLRSRLVSDTSLMWFPYRTVLATLNLTQGVWDRVMLAMSGSLPSLFGALTGAAKNFRSGRDFTTQLEDGIRNRAQQQVESRLQPLCDAFHRQVNQLGGGVARGVVPSRVELLGIDELQTRSHEIFEESMQRNALPRWQVFVLAVVGCILFWALMAAPIVVIYRDYLQAAYQVAQGSDVTLTQFPKPEAGMLLSSVFLSALPLVIYCMLVLTFVHSRSKTGRVSSKLIDQHTAAIEELQQSGVIRLQFDDPILEAADFLVNLNQKS